MIDSMTGPSTGIVAASDGLRLHLALIGGGRPVAVIASTGGFEKDLAPLAKGRTIACYHSRNRGLSGSTDDQARVGLEREIQDLDEIRRALRVESIQLLGHSYNGAVAARYAMLNPHRVQRLVLISTLGPRGYTMYPPADAALVAKARERLAKISPPQEVEPLANEVEARAKRRLGYVLADLERYDWTSECPSLAVPTLIIAGEEDWVPPEAPREWARLLPQARLLHLPNSSHLPWIECPDLFYPAIEAFLAGSWPEHADRIAHA
ncbi:MAG: alpha/beta hydrolase [Actinobacteria bacterium]|nr:alpha/beta hydrolase [Actinomycetota bacterium]